MTVITYSRSEKSSEVIVRCFTNISTIENSPLFADAISLLRDGEPIVILDNIVRAEIFP